MQIILLLTGGGMLGISGNQLNNNIARCIVQLKPSTVLEYGCGRGKFAMIAQAVHHRFSKLESIQKLFTPTDAVELANVGYTKIYDTDILDYLNTVPLERYELMVAIDVIEHFMHGDAFSIIDYSLYYCDHFLLVWPSRNLQVTPALYDIHRTSFELRDLANRFDVAYYSYSVLEDNHPDPNIICHPESKYHIALLRGHVNSKNRPLIA